MSKARCHNECLKGFTLIELVMVLVLLAIISPVAMKMWDQTNFRAKFFTDDLTVLLSQARKIALTSGCPVQIRQLDAATIAIFQQPQCNGNDYTMQLAITSTITPNVKWQAPLTIIFSASGYATAAGPLEFKINGHLFRLDAWSGLFYAA